jgi:hypothetical protein
MIQSGTILALTRPDSFKLTTPGEVGQPAEEFIFRLQGVLYEMRLPPVLNSISKYVVTFILNLLYFLNYIGEMRFTGTRKSFLRDLEAHFLMNISTRFAKSNSSLLAKSHKVH